MALKNSKRMTVKEFDEIHHSERYTYELLNGELIMQARPGFDHQIIMNNIHLLQSSGYF